MALKITWRTHSRTAARCNHHRRHRRHHRRRRHHNHHHRHHRYQKTLRDDEDFEGTGENSDSDDDAKAGWRGQLDKNFVDEMHFGGGLQAKAEVGQYGPGAEPRTKKGE